MKKDMNKYMNEVMEVTVPNPTNPACPECCFKHLMAAWAILQATACYPERAEPADVLRACAGILAGEVLAGYDCNRPVLAGYLAALEQGTSPGASLGLRSLRKDVMLGIPDGLCGLCSGNPPAAMVRANLVEAEREAPEDYWDTVKALREKAEEGSITLCGLLRAAMDIAKTYELFAQEEEKI